MKKLLILGALVAISSFSLAAIPEGNNEIQDTSIAIGNYSSTKGEQAVTVGYFSKAEGNVAIAIGSASAATNGGAVAIGGNSLASGNSAVSIGNTSKVTGFGGVAIGPSAEAIAEGAVSLGDTAKAVSKNSVAIGSSSEAKEEGTVSIGNDNIKRKITNMAAGVNDTDGVNVSQLKQKADNSRVDKLENNITKNSDNIEKNTNDIKELKRQNQDIAKMNDKIKSLDDRVEALGTKLNRGMSLMAAMNSIDFGNAEEGDLLLGAGVGHYENSQGVAIGIAYIPSKDTRVTAKYSVSTDEIKTSALGIGVTHKIANFN